MSPHQPVTITLLPRVSLRIIYLAMMLVTVMKGVVSSPVSVVTGEGLGGVSVTIKVVDCNGGGSIGGRTAEVTTGVEVGIIVMVTLRVVVIICVEVWVVSSGPVPVVGLDSGENVGASPP